MKSQGRTRSSEMSYLEQTISQVMIVILLIFMAIFLYSERGGLESLANLLIDAFMDIPTFAGDIITYYVDNEASANMMPSILIGGAIGAIFTSLLLMIHRGFWRPLKIHYWWIGAIALVALLVAGINFWISFGISLFLIVIISFSLDKDFRGFFSPQNLGGGGNLRGVSTLGFGLVTGAAGGGNWRTILELSVTALHLCQRCTAHRISNGLRGDCRQCIDRDVADLVNLVSRDSSSQYRYRRIF